MPPPNQPGTKNPSFAEVGTSLTEFLLPDRLLLNVDTTAGAIRLTNWPAYQCAVRTMLRLRGVEAHLDRVDPPTPWNKKGWNSDDRTCKAIIMLNVSNFERLFDAERMGKKAGEIWRELRSLYDASTKVAIEETVETA